MATDIVKILTWTTLEHSMALRLIRWMVACVALGTPVIALSSQRPLTLDTGVAAHAGIDAVYARFSQAYRTMDASLVAAQYSDTAAYLAPRKPIGFGRTRIEADFSRFFADVKGRGDRLEISFRIMQRRVQGNLGYDVGIYSLDAISGERTPKRSHGKFVTVVRRAPDGRWHFDVDAYNDLPDVQETDPLERDQANGPLGETLDAQLKQLERFGFSGTVLVADDGKPVLIKGYGLADVEQGLPNTAATRFEMNSMTKMFTGLALLQLEAQGRLDLDAPLERYLGAMPEDKRSATVRQLATHTAGLVKQGTELVDDSRDRFVESVLRAPAESAPGERYRYSNAGYSLLAAIIEHASGESYADYLRRHVFRPVGMTSATFRDELPSQDARFAHGYVGTPAAAVPGPPNPYAWGTIGAGGVWSSVGDIYRWVITLEAGRLLPPAQLARWMTPPQPTVEEALGWQVGVSEDGRRLLQKGGGSDDFASQLLYYPDDAVVIVWTNNDRRQRWRPTLNRVLPAIIFGREGIRLPELSSVPQEQICARARSYQLGQDVLEIRCGAGVLYAANRSSALSSSLSFRALDSRRFVAFDPAAMTTTSLVFGRTDQEPGMLTFADGQTLWLTAINSVSANSP